MDSWPMGPHAEDMSLPLPRSRRRPTWRHVWPTAAIVLAAVTVASGLVVLALYIIGFAALALSGSMK